MVEIKKVKLLVLILILLSVSIFMFNGSNKLSNMDGTSGNVKLDINPKSITIIKLGMPAHKKVVSSNEDIKDVISFFESIELYKRIDEEYKGWTYSIDMEDDNGNRQDMEFNGEMTFYGDSWYRIDPNKEKDLDDLYNKLNYTEEKYTPYSGNKPNIQRTFIVQ